MKKNNCEVVLLILLIAAIICIAILNSKHRKNMHGGNNTIKPHSLQPELKSRVWHRLDSGANGNTNKIPTYWGSGIPLETEMRYTSDVSPEEKIPTISGNGNIVGPQCCPSAYSTSSGCICPLLR